MAALIWPETHGELRRLASAATLVATGFASLVALAAYGPAPEQLGTRIAPAIIVDLAPSPAAPSSAQDIAPGPEMIETTAATSRPDHTTLPDDPLPPMPETNSDAVLQKPLRGADQPEPDNAEKTKSEQPPGKLPPAPATTAAPRLAPSDVKIAVAPRNGGAANTDGVESWKDRLLARLQHSKRYPSAARARQEHGIAVLTVVVDRDGHVLERGIAKSTGYAELDQEVLALAKRAEPLPAFPPAMTQNSVRLNVPIRFSLQ